MKNKSCPHCGNIINDMDICQKCFNLIDTKDKPEFLKIKRKLLLAVRINKIDLIFDLIEKVLLQKANDYLANYYKAYVYAYNGNKEVIKDFYTKNLIYTHEEVKEVINHMIMNKNLYDIEEIKNYITKVFSEGSKIKYYFNIIEGIDDERELDLNDLPLVRLPLIPKKNKDIPLGIFLLIFGSILMAGFWLISFNIPADVRIFTTVLLYVLPSIFMAMGLTRVIFKKGNTISSLFIFLIILILSTYIVLFAVQKNFINHIINVFKSPYDMVIYFVRKVIINI